MNVITASSSQQLSKYLRVTSPINSNVIRTHVGYLLGNAALHLEHGHEWAKHVRQERFNFFIKIRVVTKKLNSVVIVRKRTIPTERPQPVGEVSANFSW
jgi:hypothetical protein